MRKSTRKLSMLGALCASIVLLWSTHALGAPADDAGQAPTAAATTAPCEGDDCATPAPPCNPDLDDCDSAAPESAEQPSAAQPAAAGAEPAPGSGASSSSDPTRVTGGRQPN